MSAFDPPFATNGELRAPTASEKSLGFPCGPASQPLFNFLINRLEGQVDNIADQAGVSALAEDDLTLLYRAVDALIAAAVGGADTSQYVLFSQARARLPIFPEIQNTAGTLVVTAPSTGTVRVPAGTNFLHRGIFLITTAQTDFPTDPSKTYHLRWNPTDGFVLRDLASGVYNPGTLSESNPVFDSAFDDMLVARVITNSSNVATITNLANKARMTSDQTVTGDAAVITTGSGNDGARYTANVSWNFARTPLVMLQGHVGQTGSAGARYINGYANDIGDKAVTRYGATASVTSDWDSSLVGVTVTGKIAFQAIAA
jgi:hypothetical protein